MIRCLAFFLLAAPLWAQLQLCVIRGRVVGPDHQPIQGAIVALLDPLGAILFSCQTDGDGKFRFLGIAPGTYSLRAENSGLQATTRRFTIHDALPLEAELRLTQPLAEEIIVTGSAEIPSVTTRVSLAGDSVRRTPGRVRSRGLQDAVATMPGWGTEDNGMLHIRGVDDGLLYVLDGIPVYDRLDSFFGIPPDLSTISSMHIGTGYISPEFGFKSGGVVEVRSASGMRDAWSATLDIGSGSHGSRQISGLAIGPIKKSAGLMLSFAGEQSSRFLDPVHPKNFHNRGGLLGGGAQLIWNTSTKDSVTLGAGYGRSDYQVPHGEEQEKAAQDQRQRLEQENQSFSWQRTWSSQTVSQVALYRRRTNARLLGSSMDTPLFAQSNRKQSRAGVLASLTHQRRRHVAKAGFEFSRLVLREFFSFAVTSEEEGKRAGLSPKALEFKPGSPFLFRGSAAPVQWSLYLQDSYRPFQNLTLDLGLRFDHSRLLAPAQQWSPRLGVSYNWVKSRTTLRASINRFFQPPQPENLLLASSREAQALSPFARGLGEGIVELHPERQTALELGAEQWVAGAARFDIAYWRRNVRNYSDPNVFFGTTLVFPNSVARGQAAGLDVRVEVPRRKGWSGFLSYSNSLVVQYGPINGGLFLEEEILEIGPGTRFTPDHDQRNVAASGVTYEHDRSGFWFSLSGRHESGTPLEVQGEDLEELAGRPGSALVNLDRGRVKPRTLLNLIIGKSLMSGDRMEASARLEILNLTNRAYAFNFGNPFSGTHFGSPRTVAFKLRMTFR